jgi:hypothetical protein
MCGVAQSLVRDVAELLREAVADIDEPRAVSALAAAPGPPAQGLRSAGDLSEVRARACRLAACVSLRAAPRCALDPCAA